ncbi:MAG: Fur family transcriptional regulator [Clostridia bacterium]|nr:Fur family transcriptional regulator [Clostridia bacterium]
MNKLAENLKANKLKVTPQRLAIYTYLMNTGSHPTVETIYNDLKDEFPTMSLATVYKTVASLRDVNLVREFNVSEDSNRYDADTSRHAHVICKKCHNVYDYYGDVDIDKNISELQELSNFKIDSFDVNFYGICKNCQGED